MSKRRRSVSHFVVSESTAALNLQELKRAALECDVQSLEVFLRQATEEGLEDEEDSTFEPEKDVRSGRL